MKAKAPRRCSETSESYLRRNHQKFAVEMTKKMSIISRMGRHPITPKLCAIGSMRISRGGGLDDADRLSGQRDHLTLLLQIFSFGAL